MGDGFAYGEVAFFVAEVFEAFLFVEGHGVIDVVSDAALGEVCAECVAFTGQAQGVLVVDVIFTGVGDVWALEAVYV